MTVRQVVVTVHGLFTTLASISTEQCRGLKHPCNGFLVEFFVNIVHQTSQVYSVEGRTVLTERAKRFSEVCECQDRNVFAVLVVVQAMRKKFQKISVDI